MIQTVLDKLTRLRARTEARRVPDLQRALENLKTALHLRFGAGDADTDEVRQAADIIDRAAADIGRL